VTLWQKSEAIRTTAIDRLKTRTPWWSSAVSIWSGGYTVTERQLDRLERLSARQGFVPFTKAVHETIGELVNDCYRAGVSVAELRQITGLTRARIYQLLEETS